MVLLTGLTEGRTFVTAMHLRAWSPSTVSLLGSSCGECGTAALSVALDIRSYAALSAVEHEMAQVFLP